MKTLLDPHYPQYHLAPRQGWMNDPHPIYFKGAYHMFFQYSILPDDPYGGPHRWGHIMSKDLVHWEHLPPAITPKDHGIAEDRHIWSGCLVDNNGVGTAIYTIENLDIWTSTSTDEDLRVFKKHGANPVIKGLPPEPGILAEMRDPWVWKEADGWYLTVGSGLKDNKGSILPLYKSTDLIHWQYLHPLYQGDPSKGDSTFCECPFFFPLGDKYVLALSHEATWMTGKFKDERFQSERRGRLDYGRFYVPQTALDDKGRRILWGWVGERHDGDAQRRAGWAGMQTLPRVMSLADDGTLRFDPAPELDTLRAEHQRGKNLIVGNRPIAIPNSRGMQGELKVVLAPRSAKRCGLILRDKAELMRITYDAVTKTLQCADQSIPLALATGEDLTLRVFMDRSVVEVYANRKVCVVERIYPQDIRAVEARLFAEAGEAKVKQVDAWQMKSIWDSLDEHCMALGNALWWLPPADELRSRLPTRTVTAEGAASWLAGMVKRQKELPGACRSAARELYTTTKLLSHPRGGRAGPARRGRPRSGGVNSALAPQGGEPSLPANADSPKAARLRELLGRIEERGLAGAAYEKTLARTLKGLLKDPSWPLLVNKFKASRLQAPVADIAAARLPRPGLARQDVPFDSGGELADIRSFHGGADGLIYIEATVKLNRAYRGALAYGADGPVKVWVNGRAADCRPKATNPAIVGAYVTPVSWKKGVNRITFALATNHGNAWGVQARVLRARKRA